MNLKRSDYTHSVNLNNDTDFPYLVLDVINDHSYPRNAGFQVMHWHEDLQFIYVFEGTVELSTLDNAIQVQSGEALFINKDVVHHIKHLSDCHYNSFLFPAYFISFYTGSPTQRMVENITANEQLPFLRFTQEIEWQREILFSLRQLVQVECEKSSFYSYEILVLLSSLWLKILKNIDIPPFKKESILQLRMRKFLRYIETHYAEDLVLADLAKSAEVSKSECLRCFKLSLNTTPYQYLIEYRLMKAVQLLISTNESIGNIANNVGFHQLSYFGKCFKAKTGYSPRTYREMKQIQKVELQDI